MKKIISIVLAVMMIMTSAVIFASCTNNNGTDDTKTNIVLGSGGTTGTYYAYSNAVATILNRKVGSNISVVSTGGSVANLNGIADGDYKMAIVQNDTMINAYNGFTDKFPTAIKNFSVVAEVYSEVIQIVVDGSLKSKVKTLADLKGLRVSVGDVGSGVADNAKEILAAVGIDVDKDIVKNNLSVGKSADAMKDNGLDAFFFTSGAPTTAITELAQTKDIYLLSIDENVMDAFIANHKIDNKYEVYSKMEITNAMYSCVPSENPVRTIGVTATFIVSNELSADLVYSLTKAIWESVDEIGAAHAVGKSMNVANATVSIGNVPVHEGAQKYYAELGK